MRVLMPCSVRRLSWIPVVALCIVAHPARGQRVVTADDYARAERSMTNAEVSRLGAEGLVTANWLPKDQFWYRTAAGEVYMVNPARKTRTLVPAADTAKLPRGVQSAIGGGRGGRGGGGGGGRGGAGGGNMSSDGKPLTMSPDGSRGVFIRDFNLWVKEMPGGQETQLTTDGVKDFGYSTNNAGWTKGANAIGLWSPDSKKFATQQQDERGVGHMFLVTTPTGHEAGRGGAEQVFSDDPARDYRRAGAQGGPPADAARPASRHGGRQPQHGRPQVAP
jgi:hypothetical protein